MSLPFFLVDAFTDRAFGGTPHAVILDADDLSKAMMQAVAREMNHSETAFLRRSNRADFGVRYFSPNQEVPMAGSPTIATVHALLESGRLALNGEPILPGSGASENFAPPRPAFCSILASPTLWGKAAGLPFPGS
jgi:PhzF family phenazine biosynthesis protein